MFQEFSKNVLREISKVLNAIDEEEVNKLIQAILNAKKIVTCGAGRMGMMARAFAMRLSHLGKEAYNISDCNTPSIGKGDLLLVSSGSGETKTILVLVEIAKQQGSGIALVTARSHSTIANLADVKVILPALSKIEDEKSAKSIQPMTSLTEQSCLMFFDTLTLILMQKLGQTQEILKARHSILE